MIKNTKSQAWMLDLIIAFTLLSTTLIAFFIYSINNSSEAKDIIESLQYNGNNIMSSILSEGYPSDWNKSNVIRIGIIDNNKINETKLENFYNLTSSNYPKTKVIFNTNFDYYFFLDINMTINSNVIEGIGKPGTKINNLTSNNQIKLTRLIIYKNKPTTAYLYIWE